MHIVIITGMSGSGKSVVVVTHDPGLAAQADRRLNIVDGKIAP